jgi:hypothetical protein
MMEEMHQTIVDEEHLKLLALGYVIEACVSLFFSLFGLMYLFMGFVVGAAFSHMPKTASSANAPPPQLFMWFFGGIGVTMFVLMVVMAALKFRTAWCLKHRRSRTFCMVIAGISCLGIPYGTILGILTFMVLGRESVTQSFASRGPAAPLAQS